MYEKLSFGRVVMADGICPGPIRRSMCQGTMQTNQATTSDSQAGQLRSSDPYKELDSLADNFWNILCHTHTGGFQDCSRCHLPGRLHGTQSNPCCLLLLSSEIREVVAKNRPPMFLQPNLAGTELLDLFNNRHLCQTLYMSLD